MARKPVVFIPGFPASSLETDAGEKVFPPSLADVGQGEAMVARLRGPDDPNADDGINARSPIRFAFRIPLVDGGKEAQSLYDLLEGVGYDTTEASTDFAPVGWDWRRSVDAVRTLDAVEAAIRRLPAPVTLLCHSTGGLVAWALLAERPALAPLVEQVIALGVPWHGVVVSFLYLSSGIRFGIGPLTLLTADQSRRLMSTAHAAYDLLPPQPADPATPLPGHPLFTDSGLPVSPLTHRGWVPAADQALYLPRLDGALDRLGQRGNRFPADLPICNVAGWGVRMVTRYELATDDAEESDLGDGTVPFASATWLGGPQVQTLPLPAGVYADQLITQKHSQLWNTPPVKRLLAARLTGEPPAVWFAAAVDSDAAVDPAAPILLRAAAAGADGRSLPGATLRIPQLPAIPPLVLGGAVRAELALSRANLLPNVGTQFFRFEVELRFTGAPAPLRAPLIVNV
ncbi:MAG TPA: hypothetical protein VGV61_13715 [Thermoanaerobaculia bacterium]|jgi:pimeloyl-ACP methyl ester carboxylesterase|nr:hypothetical protein [Thermoanaerobaculia bacterium]